MKYVASLSCRKDSLAMVLRLMEEKKPLDYCVMYDTGMEFNSIYNNVEKIKPILKNYGCEFVRLAPKTDFLTQMLLKPVNRRDGSQKYGYEWCGGVCRWRTSDKVNAINNFLNSLGDNYIQYIGIAEDEPEWIKNDNNKVYPLVEWKMKESDCLKYCYEHGWNWNEDGIELYSILDRVSCWCCKNKNLKELKNIYKFLPNYWGLLKGLQSRIDMPFRNDGKTIFDLEKRFENETQQELF